MCIAFVVIGCFPLVHHHAVRWWALAIAAVFAILALAVPRVLSVPNRLWMGLGLWLSRIVSPVALFVVYVLAVLPTGLLRRLRDPDPLNLRWLPQADTYWQRREPPGRADENMKNQF